MGFMTMNVAFAIITSDLPKDHWLYKSPVQMNTGGAVDYEAPPMTMLAGRNDSLRKAMEPKVREALRYALRAATRSGREDDFDPDALEQNLIVGLFGYFTENGLSSDDWANSPYPIPISLINEYPDTRLSWLYPCKDDNHESSSGSDSKEDSVNNAQLTSTEKMKNASKDAMQVLVDRLRQQFPGEIFYYTVIEFEGDEQSEQWLKSLVTTDMDRALDFYYATHGKYSHILISTNETDADMLDGTPFSPLNLDISVL